MKTRKLLISILTGLCVCLTGTTLLTACKDDHTHSYTQQTTTEATCTEKGVITYTCSCNDTYTEEIPATGEHTWNNGEITTEPTCTEKGVKTFTCTVCETATYTEDVNALGHDEESHQAQAPTCTEIGWNEYVTCQREGCDCSTYEEIPALTHDKVQHQAQAATCTEKGWNAYETCTRCDYTTYVEIPALTHDKVQHQAQAATCTEKGWNAYETCTRCDYTTYVEIPALTHDKVQHQAQAATCTEKGWNAYETCSRCDYTTYVEIPALTHDKVQHNAQAATCTEKGWNAYETCTRCSYTTYAELPALNHDKVQHNAQTATCTEKGWNAYETCTRCSYTTYAELPALNHDKVQHNAQAATCTEKGWNAYETCSRCDYTTYVEIPALTHDKVQHQAQAATCTEKGWNAYETCSRCDYTTYVEIPATGEHTWNDGEITTQPTCTEKGIKTFTCTICETTTYTEDVAALTHSIKSYEAKEPTCTEIGWNAHEACERGGCTYTTCVEIPALGHDEKSHEGKAVTCTEKGWNAYVTCEREGCGYTTYKEFPATGHSEIEHPEESATCQHSGYTSYITCKNCSYATEREEIPVQDHLFRYYISDGNATCKRSGTKTAYCEYGCGTKNVLKEEAGSHYPVYEDYLVAPTATSDGYYEYWVACKYCDLDLEYDKIILTNSGSSSGSSDSDRWKSNPLLLAVPYPTGAKVERFDFDNVNTQLGGYYGWAGGYFTASQSVINNYLAQIATSAYTYNVEQTYASYRGYNASRTRMLSIGFVGNDLTILLYKLEKENTSAGEGDHTHKFNIATCVGATCTQKGYTIGYCLCGQSYRELTPPFGHTNLETIEGYAPTCTATGLTDGIYCWDCYQMILPQETISALGHNDVDGICSRCQTPIEYKVDFIVEGEIYQTLNFNVHTMNSLVAPVVPDKKGHTGVWAAYEMKKENFTVEAIYTANTYTVTYVLNGGTNNENNPTEYVFGSSHALYAPTIDGELIIFGGWFTDTTFMASSAISSISSDMAQDLTLYAQWLRHRVEIADGFDINYDGTMPELATRVSNATERFSFKNIITVSEGCDWEVYADEYASQSFAMKVVPLTEGNNTYYIVVFSADKEYYTQYIVNIYRRKLFTVSFDTQNGTSVASQTVEEDSLATVPETTRLGYTFVAWDYDFTTPITGDTEITASWKANEDTKYTVEYHFQNLENDKYTLYESVECQGTTDTTATAKIKEYAHFTYNATESAETISGNIHPDGSGVLKVYYTRNVYTLSINSTDGTITNAGSYRYGNTHISSTITVPMGYDFLGWYSGEELLSMDTTYTFTAEQNVMAKIKIKEGLEIFYIRCTQTMCKITGLKDKTLTEIIIPDYVTAIGDDAFKYCYSLTSITIPDSVTSIGSYAFYGCDSLTSVIIPDSVTSIGSGAFEYCNSLTSVVIGDSVTSIGPYAFRDCSSLTSVVIGTSVTSIGELAFGDCYKLVEVVNKSTHITVNKGSSSNGYVGYYAVWIYNSDSGITESQLTNDNGYIVYTDGAEKILAAYIGFETNLVLPSYITQISQNTFENCDRLTSVVIGDSVTSIGSSAFFGCSKLTEITLPFVGGSRKTANDTYQYPFGYIFGTSSYTGGTATKQYYYGSSTSNTTYTTYYIPTSLKKVTITGGNILYGALYNCSKLTSVTIPDSVTSIGDYAFYYCSSLTSVVIPDSVKSISSYAFRGCSSLTSVVIPDSVKSIGAQAFRGCSSLTEMTIPFVGAKAGVTASDTYQYPFGYIFGTSSYTGGTATIQYYYGSSTSSTTYTTYYIPTSLKKVTITGGNILYGAFYDCSSLTSVTIPDSVTTIGDYAFYSCDSLTSVTIPDSVTTIGDYAFYNCDSLTSVTIPDSVITIGSDAFCVCDSLTSVIIGDSVTSIGEYAFYNCDSLTSVEIGDSVTSIGNSAFGDCSSLTEIVIPDSITSIGSYAFRECSSLTKIVIPDSVTSIGSSAFEYCSSLTSVVIGNSVTSIGSSAFAYCSSLTSVVIGDSVTSIGYRAFEYCSSLTSVVIPDSVTSIGGGAFYNCSSLTSIKYRGTQEQWNTIDKGSYWNYYTGSYTITYNYKG